RYGFPTHERFRLLDVPLWWTTPVFQLSGCPGPGGSRLCTGRRLVRLRAAYCARILSRPQPWLLDSKPAARERWPHRVGPQRNRYHLRAALSGYEVDAHATACLADARNKLHDPAGTAWAIGGANHAAD